MSDLISRKSRINEIVEEVLCLLPGEITPYMNLRDDFVADSLDFVDLVMTLEDEFDVEIPDAEFEKVRIIQDLYELPSLNK